MSEASRSARDLAVRWNRFGPLFAAEIRKRRVSGMRSSDWPLDEVFVKINGELHYLWRAVDHERQHQARASNTKKNISSVLGNYLDNEAFGRNTKSKTKIGGTG